MSISRRAVVPQLTAAQVADAFGRAAKTLERRFDERLGAHSGSTPRFRLLAEIQRLEPVRVSAVATAAGIAQGTASVLVDALAKDGLVDRVTDHKDRRAMLITLTDEGRRRIETWTHDYEMAADELLAALPRRDWPHLVAMLQSLSSTANG